MVTGTGSTTMRTIMDEAGECSNNKCSSRTRSIAIVGAGFAGLTLASFLECKRRKSSKDEYYEFQIFESKPSPIPICGPIRLPHGRQVLSELGLLNYLEQQQEEEGNDDMVFDEEVFMNLLRSRVGHAIRYSTEVISIKRRQDKQYFIHIKDKHDPLGPFNMVVVADGLFGLTFHQENNEISFVIGDARWQKDVWFWDFGRKRRQKGADIAICDAMELGKLIINVEEKNQTNGNDVNSFALNFQSKISLLLRGPVGLFSVPLIVGIFLQLLLQMTEDKTTRL